MAKKDDTSKGRPARNQTAGDVSAETSQSTFNQRSAPIPARTQLEQAIEAERARLLQASAVLHCLYQVLLYAEGEDAVTYAEAAQLTARLIGDSVAQLDLVRLEPMIDAIKHASERKQGDYPITEEKLSLGGDDEVREPDFVYRH